MSEQITMEERNGAEKGITRKAQILVEVKHLRMYFPVTSGIIMQKKIADVKAVDDISLYIRKGETVGLVGESGCGKTTTGRCILQLCRPTSGEVLFDRTDLCKLKGETLRQFRRRMTPIFQDPYSSLNPRWKAASIVGDPLKIFSLVKSKREYEERTNDLLRIVGLNPYMRDRYPHEFSGGERQRIGIARALATEPDLIVCDEPISALDVSIQAQVLNLLEHLREEFSLTYLFIAHDLAVVRHMADRICVMYLGKICESSPRDELYSNALHPYTRAIISAAPIPDPIIEEKRERIILTGNVPSAINPPQGCNFHPRCWMAIDRCREEVPELRQISGEHYVACHLV